MGVKDKINGIEAKDLGSLRRRLMAIEGKCSRHYFGQIFQLFPEKPSQAITN